MSEPDLLHHGDVETAAGLADFAVNVAVPQPPPWLLRALRDALDGVAAYPDSRAATDALARMHGCPARSVLVTNGAAEAFTLVARGRAWARPVVVHPQFTEPEVALNRAGHEVGRVTLSGDNGFRLDHTVVPKDADLVVVGNPTNPTSRLHPAEEILALVRPGRLVVVDEAFMDVVTGESQSLVDRAAQTPGMAVVRSLTKTFGLAGVRAGYVVATPAVVAELAEQQHHWSVNSLALAATVACSGEEGQRHASDVAKVMSAHTAHLCEGLRGLGLRVVDDPAAPFVLVTHPHAAALRERLRDRGFAVRRGDTFPGLGPDWIRIAARPAVAVDGLLAAMSRELEILGD